MSTVLNNSVELLKKPNQNKESNPSPTNKKICPMCNEMGTEVNIRSTRVNRKKIPVMYHYIKFVHKQSDTWKDHKVCYLGSAKELTATEYFKDMEKQNFEQAYILEKNLNNIRKGIKEYFENYNQQYKKVVQDKVYDDVMAIVDKYYY